MHFFKSIIKHLLLILTLTIHYTGHSSESLYPDFKAAMIYKTGASSEELQEREQLYHLCNSAYLHIFESLYQRNLLDAQNRPNETLHIPHIIHQIYLNKETSFNSSIQQWAKLHNWKYKLWTDYEISQLPLYNKDLYNHATSYEEKSNIARLEILSLYGGVFIDNNYEYLNPEIFEEIHKDFDFYIKFEPMEQGRLHRFNIFKISNALIGSIPHHPLIQDIITNMKPSYLAYQHSDIEERSGSTYCTRILCKYAASEYALNGPIVFRTMYLPSGFFP